MKVLYLDTGFDSSSEYFRVQREKVEGCTNQCLYKNQNKSILSKIVMALGIYAFSPLLYFVYGDWKNQLDQYDMFIVVSRKAAKYAIEYIKQKTGKRVVVWYWNMVTDKELSPNYCKNVGCEPWSFDRNDCKKYNMNFGDTYYFPPEESESSRKIDSSIFYVGINRPGRKELLIRLGKYLENNELKYRFNLTAIPTESAAVKAQYSPRMKYEEIIEAIHKSAAVLDLNRENQSGMTLRPMEALFFKRKLVTNNESITRYCIYDKENTFILKDDSFDGLVRFLTDPYIDNEVNENKRKTYSFAEWLRRIEANQEAI